MTFWHEVPEINPRASADRLGEYYMLFREKADYAGHYDAAGIPMLDYHGVIGLQYNPIAIAQWGLANYNRFCETGTMLAGRKLSRPPTGSSLTWNRMLTGFGSGTIILTGTIETALKAPWYSGLAQGQGVSLLLRAHAMLVLKTRSINVRLKRRLSL